MRSWARRLAAGRTRVRRSPARRMRIRSRVDDAHRCRPSPRLRPDALESCASRRCCSLRFGVWPRGPMGLRVFGFMGLGSRKPTGPQDRGPLAPRTHGLLRPRYRGPHRREPASRAGEGGEQDVRRVRAADARGAGRRALAWPGRARRRACTGSQRDETTPSRSRWSHAPGGRAVRVAREARV